MTEITVSATDALRGSGLRATAARRAIIEVLREMQRHMTVSEVISALGDNGSSFDKSTVYRVLGDLGCAFQVIDQRSQQRTSIFS